ncbi:UNVERIFIED_CONTAM: hypothetical protein RMT77_016758 [Armadillidium vulgare]
MVHLDETSNNCDQIPGGNYVVPIPSNPLLVLSILPLTGPYNFRINIPEPNLLGVKPQWCYSKMLNRMYVAKNVAFPLNIMLDKYPPRAHLNICPVYNKSSNRMAPVHRCPNCRLSDPNQENCLHVIQVEGSSAYYYEQEERYMVSVPLGTPAPGDSLVNLFLKVCCNTSCIGGPNRRTFSILISLKLGDNEYGRQVIDVKCCEGPTRDMNRDEKNQMKETILQPVHQNTNENMEKFREVASEVAKSRSSNTPNRKRKVSNEPDFEQHKKESLEMEMVMIPKIYVKRVKKYINSIYVKDQLRKRNPQDYSKTKIFQTSTDSD